MRKEAVSFSLIVGCGASGLGWASRQSGEVRGLDNDPSLFSDPLLIKGDVLSLDPELGPFKRIYADFLLNAVFPRGVNFAEVINRPSILQKPPFPPLVRDWYQETFLSLNEPVNKHLKTIGWLIRTTALQQMWGVLAEGGEIIIVDKRKIVEWVADRARELLDANPENIQIVRSPISPDDRARSNARTHQLRYRYPNAGKKIVLKKTGSV